MGRWHPYFDVCCKAELLCLAENSYWILLLKVSKHLLSLYLGFSCGSAGKESACNAGDLGLIPGLGISPGKGKGYPLQYSSLENSMDCIVHGVTKSQTRLSDFHFLFIFGERRNRFSNLVKHLNLFIPFCNCLETRQIFAWAHLFHIIPCWRPAIGDNTEHFPTTYFKATDA